MKIEMVETSTIIPYARNPRKNQDAVDSVAASIREFGFRQPIVVDEHMTIVVGHTRWQAAKKLKIKEVPIHIATGLTPEQIKAYRLADNRTNENATWDNELLALELKELEGMFTGFTDEDIATIFAENNPEEYLTDEDEVPPEPDDTEVVSQLGDIWTLGDHKVMCGSSTDEEIYRDLLGKEQIDLVWTDPPYNVAYQSAGERKGYASYGAGKLHDKIENDDMDSEQFYNFLKDALTQANQFTKKGGCIYIAHSDMEGINFRRAMKDAGWKNSQLLIWVKPHPVLSRQDYNSAHEPMLYGWKEGKGHYFCKDFTLTTVIDKQVKPEELKKEQLLEIVKQLFEQSTIIREKNPTVADLHPTMKPVALVERMVKNSSQPGEIVFDGFGGSGSTLIACENAKRKARIIELAPKYVDVIVKRWEDYTGKKATLNGKTSDEIREERLG